MTADINVRAATVVFGAIRAVDAVSLEVGEGQCFAIVGESGSGKTTLMRAILGVQPLASGSIMVAGTPVDSTAAGFRRRARLIQPIFQDPVSSLSPRLRIRSLFLEAGRLAGMGREEACERMGALFARMALPSAVADRFRHQISGGQARRVAICRALMMDPRILVADEPTAGLDLSAQGELMNLLQDLRRERGLTILLVTHQLAVARMVSDETAVMFRGQLVEHGRSEQVFSVPIHAYTARLLKASGARV